MSDLPMSNGKSSEPENLRAVIADAIPSSAKSSEPENLRAAAEEINGHAKKGKQTSHHDQRVEGDRATATTKKKDERKKSKRKMLENNESASSPESVTTESKDNNHLFPLFRKGEAKDKDGAKDQRIKARRKKHKTMEGELNDPIPNQMKQRLMWI